MKTILEQIRQNLQLNECGSSGCGGGSCGYSERDLERRRRYHYPNYHSCGGGGC